MTAMKWSGLILLVLSATGYLSPIYAVDEQRQAYERMVQEATREADEYVKQKQEAQRQTTEMGQNRTDSEFDQRIQAERDRLKAEMDTVRGRGLGPNFTEGMRANQLQELQNQLNRLNSDPKAYFGE